MEGAVRHPDQPVYRKTQAFHCTADFAVLAFAQAYGGPGIGTLLAVQRHLHALEPFAIQRDALAQRVEVAVLWAAFETHAILPQPAGRWQFQLSFHRAVIGQQQQTFGIQVQPPNGHHTGQFGWQIVKYGGSAQLILRRCHPPGRLVIKPHARRLRLGQRFAIYSDFVLVGHVQRGAVDLLAVHGDPPGFNHPLCFTAGGDACAGQDFGNTVAGRCFVVHVRGLDHRASLRKRGLRCRVGHGVQIPYVSGT